MSPPDEPTPNPFEGMPIFGDLARMFTQQGPVAWDAARQLAVSVAQQDGPEGNVDPLERIGIEQLARVAELQVGTATGLTPARHAAAIAFRPVTRAQWAHRTLDDYRPLFDTLGGSLHAEGPPAEPAEADADPATAWMAPLMQMIGPMMLGMTAGSMVGHLSRRAFGQYDIPLPRPEVDDLLIVPANLDAFATDWSIPPEDLRLWVCLHEVTTHAVLGVPHVRARYLAMLHEYLSGFSSGGAGLDDLLEGLDVSDPSRMGDLQSLFGDPETLLGAIRSPAQEAMLPRLEALVTVLVGYVDHVMDRVGTGLIASGSMLAEAVRRHRVEADPSDRFIERLFGLELGQATYDRGAAFAAGVVERAGADGLARLWVDEAHLPTPAEVDAPGLWLARIDLPGDPPDAE